jgi:hypothetical protein
MPNSSRFMILLRQPRERRLGSDECLIHLVALSRYIARTVQGQAA